MIYVLFGLLTLVQIACSETAEREKALSAPLQPLIYTEYPDLTPDGAAVRERRLIRQLLQSGSGSEWGTLEATDAEDLDDLADLDALGNAVIEALIQQDEKLWEHLFVDAPQYAALVNVSEGEGREFVDNQMGESLNVWELFASSHSSEIPAGGLSAQLEFEAIEVGRARDIHGSLVEEDDEAVQFWHNTVTFRHVDTGVMFELRIPRVFRLEDPDRQMPLEESSGPEATTDDDEDEIDVSRAAQIYRVASPIEADSKIDVFLDVGLHLKPQLLRETEYPFPLGHGSFWRYRRFDADEGVEEVHDPLEQRFDDRPEGLNAEEVIVEVREVSRYGTIRLVELLRSYDDRRHTRIREWWILTPRRIYSCDSSCRHNIDDVDWLIGYFQREIPILRFPLRLGEQWSAAGRPNSEGQFIIDEDWHQIETPAGSFAGTYRIYGTGSLPQWDRYLRDVDLVRDFAPGRGIVRREITTAETSEEQSNIIEELVEYRLMF